jgi:hypothetical protein
LIEGMNVMERAGEQNGIKLTIVEVWPGGEACVYAELAGSGNRITVRIDRYEVVPIVG